jgi:hypothetical protein
MPVQRHRQGYRLGHERGKFHWFIHEQPSHIQTATAGTGDVSFTAVRAIVESSDAGDEAELYGYVYSGDTGQEQNRGYVWEAHIHKTTLQNDTGICRFGSYEDIPHVNYISGECVRANGIAPIPVVTDGSHTIRITTSYPQAQTVLFEFWQPDNAVYDQVVLDGLRGGRGGSYRVGFKTTSDTDGERDAIRPVYFSEYFVPDARIHQSHQFSEP